jgi:hypothetical protein
VLVILRLSLLKSKDHASYLKNKVLERSLKGLRLYSVGRETLYPSREGLRVIKEYGVLPCMVSGKIKTY